ncbi:hypothetical protein [Bacillus suaedae]|uniref:DUF3993 domain-containing protein n=1 Tax=Halalkalibacter suaedae TaxID=2822140 RepID=A0A940WTF4_9BACI|nr:hypothetical protein [Bacillus suaedae]MBP3949878.1 hypothetical protein [Bacillus suaedae]
MNKHIFTLLLLLLSLSGCFNQVREQEAIAQYDLFLENVHELFGYHTIEDGLFYNEFYHTKESIRSHLSEFMTDEGVSWFLNEFYMLKDGRYVYAEKVQNYLNGEGSSNFYDVMKNSVFNPGLRMIVEEDIKINDLDGEIEMKMEDAPIQFYQQGSTYGESEFGELGYPSTDYISVRVVMVKDDETYRISYLEVQS